MTSPDRWIKAIASNDSGACVELRRRMELVEIRDSKNGDSGPTLKFSPADFGAWLRAAKEGRLDHLSLVP
jgi:hypothetical protein